MPPFRRGHAPRLARAAALLSLAGCSLAGPPPPHPTDQPEAEAPALLRSCTAPDNALPPFAREFRGVWVASVSNIDWPSERGLPVEQQRAELLTILDRAAELKLNAVVLQVRPAGDALYESALEPWSEYLTGEQGRPPEPFWDPLAFAVQEAHRRGLELHAWFNPFRARHPSARSPLAPGHLGATRPELVRAYGTHLWMDPGEPEVREHSIEVVLDVVRRYDVDGVHIDDYFYPYRERDGAGKLLDFPDSASWARHAREETPARRDDWRRGNVDTFVERLYGELKREKPWVKFGVSPFGIWRPGHPPQIQGFDPYLEIYADSKKWLENGWLDYFAPQLYWAIEPPQQSYPVLLRWWAEQNRAGRHIWPGNYTGRVGRQWRAAEILAQIERTREEPGAGGNVHFSMRALLEDRDGLADALRGGAYAAPALVPASPWLDHEAPAPPCLTLAPLDGGWRLELEPAEGEAPWLWALRLRQGDAWSLELVPGGQRILTLPAGADAPESVAASAVDRTGNESAPVLLTLPPAR